MTIADYIIKHLADIGVKHIFTVVGGGSMYLNDALKKEPRITPVFCHHEQACAFAAEGYARVKNQLAVVLVTSGPGGINCLTGVAGQWTDSVPVLYISGQVKYKTTLHANGDEYYGLRQMGDQEVNIIDMVAPITKHAKMILPEDNIKYELGLAINYATSGRKGPAWLDIPVDIQNKGYVDNSADNLFITEKVAPIEDVKEVVSMLHESKRPLIVAGHGIRLGNAIPEFNELINNVEIPVVTTFNGFDLVDSNHHNYVGRIGTIGTRAGNFALQNADLILFLGTRNNIRQISYNWENFAPNARKIIVDIDQVELDKNTVRGDMHICCDVKDFLQELNHQMVDYPVNDEDIKWLDWCRERKEKYPVVLDEYNKKLGINPYYFIQELTKELSYNYHNAIIVAANGTASIALFQAGLVRKGQRIFWNSGMASMGYALPAAIGACLASGREVICIEGDGSLQMNIQELATIKHYNLPIRIFVLCNCGYKSLQTTQENHFNGDYTGSTLDDLTFPDLENICNAYGLGYEYMGEVSHLEHMLYFYPPIITEVVLGNYEFAPKLGTVKTEDGNLQSPSLENMSPMLSKEEMEENKVD